MKTIELTQGQVAIVDDEDYEMLMDRKWFAHKSHIGTYYAKTNVRISRGKQSTVCMHRVIMGAQKREEVDHLNHNTLDNRRMNLRTCTTRQNHQNRVNQGKSPYPGVSQVTNSPKWKATIRAYGKQLHLGVYDTEIEASQAYRDKCKEIKNACA